LRNAAQMKALQIIILVASFVTMFAITAWGLAAL
jgi:hypothetical protein